MINKSIDKNLLTNGLAIGVILLGYISPIMPETLTAIGFFSFSGAMTNWLAIHMLFEKVPYLRGSGVIPERFEEFKTAIKQMMMQQFFSEQNIANFIQKEEQQGARIINLQPFLDAIDYERIFQSLNAAIMESPFGSMLAMMGGEEALIPLKQPFTDKIQLALLEMTNSDRFQLALQQGLNAHKISENIIEDIEKVIDNRLNELTPHMVKQMVQQIIKEHLGWLVVWGGVFGGVMGLIYAIF